MGADVNNQDNEGKTPLMEASNRGHIQTMETLINFGAKLELKSINGSALHYSTNMNDPKFCEFLLNAGANLDAKNHYGMDPIVYATITGRKVVAHYLLDRKSGTEMTHDGSYNRLLKYIESEIPSLPLHHAAINNNSELIAELASRGLDVNLKVNFPITSGSGTTESITPLSLAINGYKMEAAEELIKRGANLSDVDNKLKSDFCMSFMQYRMAEQFCMFAVQHTKWDEVDKNGMPSWQLVAKFGTDWMISELVRMGADVNSILSDGTTPIFHTNSENFQTLVDLGADLNMIQMSSGDTALHKLVARSMSVVISIESI